MKHRDGGKFKGKHTTLIDLAAKVVDIADELPKVTGISAGYIQSGNAVSGGTRKVKIGEGKGSILLTVRQSRSVQEIRVFSPDVEKTRLALARALRDQGIPISFNH